MLNGVLDLDLDLRSKKKNFERREVMNYAIIAAGEGSRLRKEGFTSVKPLVRVQNEYLIERLIRLFKENKAENITIIINEDSDELKQFLNSRTWNVDIHLIVKSTPSSLHSFWNIIHHSKWSECCLTTVDTIFNEKDFHSYIEYFQNHQSIDALMATTKYIDDEKPLYIEVNEETQENNGEIITAYCDTNEKNNCDRISAGIYCFRQKAIDVVDKAINEGTSRMRNYQRMLVEQGLDVRSFLFSKVIDIDHINDISKAEDLLKKNKIEILAVERFAEYSPNSENKDKQIIKSVANKLGNLGYSVNIKNEKDLNFSKDYCKYVISMARNPMVVSCFDVWQKDGAIILNSPLSCHNCYRERQTKIFIENNIPIPKSEVILTDNKDLEKISWIRDSEYWLKRADFQTIEEIDVTKRKTLNEGYQVLKNYLLRGIHRAVISENIEGDVVKFYGVQGTNWFYYYYPTEDKFHNKVNQTDSRIQFNDKEFIKICEKAAQLLDLNIYGGDAIIDSYGKPYIIDMNDFPSFSKCREEAAQKIVERFINKCSLD